jgi:hypothetical protein
MLLRAVVAAARVPPIRIHASMPDEPDPTPPTGRIRAARKHITHGASAVTRDVVDAVGDLAAGVVVPMTGAVVEKAGDLVQAVPAVARQLSESTKDAAAKGRKRYRTRASVRRHEPLPNLFDVHPEAKLAATRELGLQTIGVDEIRGTAVAGPAQRGTDFQPLPAFRSSNWEGRWQRIRQAVDRLESLPPIDVLWTPEGYWVTDGHNRVAAALDVGQVGIDADVKAVLLPGVTPPRPSGSLAAALAESAQVEAAGSGRLTRGSTLGRTVHDHDIAKHAPPPPADTPAPPKRDDGTPSS